jgi:hypothetical protein
MDKAVKTEWIACLRSGTYEKTTEFRLRDVDNRYDPIGVLCDRAVAAGVLPEPRFFDRGVEGRVFFGYTYESDKHTTATRIPKAVEEWAGIEYWTANHIQSMSDKGKSFDEIATWIEENL